MDPHKTGSEYALLKKKFNDAAELVKFDSFFNHHISKLMTYHSTTIKNFDIGIKYIRIHIFDVL